MKIKRRFLVCDARHGLTRVEMELKGSVLPKIAGQSNATLHLERDDLKQIGLSARRNRFDALYLDFSFETIQWAEVLDRKKSDGMDILALSSLTEICNISKTWAPISMTRTISRSLVIKVQNPESSAVIKFEIALSRAEYKELRRTIDVDTYFQIRVTKVSGLA